MDSLESLVIGDNEIGDMKDQMLMAICALGLDGEDLNFKHLLKTLGNLFFVINDRLDELDGHRRDVSSLTCAYDASRNKLNSSIQDHLKYEELWLEEKESLEAEVASYRRQIRTLHSKLVTREENVFHSTDNLSAPKSEERSEQQPIDVVEGEGELVSELSNDVSPDLKNTSDDDTVSELKRELTTLRFKLGMAESIYQDACGDWALQFEAQNDQELELRTRLGDADTRCSELMVRNDNLKAEIRNVRLELEELRLENENITVINPSTEGIPSTADGCIPLSADFVERPEDSILEKLSANAKLIETLNQKYLVLDSIISDLKRTATGFTINRPMYDFAPPRRGQLPCLERSTMGIHREPKVVFLGDSFLYGIRDELSLSLPSKYESIALRSSEATLPALLRSLGNSNFKPDYLVLSAGFVDVSYNELRAYKHEVMKFCQHLVGTRLIILNVPFNFTLPPWSIVNMEIYRCNKFLSSLPRKFKLVQVIGFDSLRREMISSKTEDPYYSREARQILGEKIKKAILSPAQPLPKTPQIILVAAERVVLSSGTSGLPRVDGPSTASPSPANQNRPFLGVTSQVDPSP